MRALAILLVLALLGAGTGWWLTAPRPLAAAEVDGLVGDAGRGRVLFAAAGCASCHVAGDAAYSDQPVLLGGQRFVSDFGTFLAPNISPSEEGIGGWTDAEVVNAVSRGVSPGGAHYYPAFPYGSYIRADLQDVADIVAHIRTLPADATPSQPHEVGFPFNIRRAVGGWKLLFLNNDWVMDGDLTETEARGRYLVEALAHCGECHTPRNALGALRRGAWLGGAPNPSGDGRIPNITSAALDWTEAQIAEYLSSGFTPEFDTAGGEMAEVVKNTAQLTPEDRLAIAAYVKAVPDVADVVEAEAP